MAPWKLGQTVAEAKASISAYAKIGIWAVVKGGHADLKEIRLQGMPFNCCFASSD